MNTKLLKVTITAAFLLSIYASQSLGANSASVPAEVSLAPEKSVEIAEPGAALAGDLVWDYGPGSGTLNGCWSNFTGNQNFAEDVNFTNTTNITSIVIFTCIAPNAGTVHIKVRDDAGGFPSNVLLYDADVLPTSWVADPDTGGYKVSADLPGGFSATGGTTYWVGMSGNGFELGQYAVRTPDDGLFARFSGPNFDQLATEGDQMFQLFSTGGPAISTLYGVTGDGGSPAETLFELDKTDASSTFVLTLGNGTDGEAIAYNPVDGLIYHASGHFGDGNVIFESIDSGFTGTTNIDITGTALTDEEAQALTWDASRGEFLWKQGHFSNGPLFSVTSLGVPTLIGNVDHQAKGLAFVGPTLYSVDRGSSLLRTMDPANASTLGSVSITLAGFTVVGGNGLATDPTDNSLWALLKVSELPGQSRVLATVDPITGVATYVGTTDVSGMAGLAIAGSSADPAPVANDDDYITDEDTPLNVPAPGVLSNDTSANPRVLFAAHGGGNIGAPFGGEIGTIDLNAGTYTALAPSFGSLTSLVSDGSFLYTYETQTASILKVDPVTGAVLNSVPFVTGPLTDMAYDQTTGVFYGVGADVINRPLYSIDVNTGAAIFITNLLTGGGGHRQIASAPDGTLYYHATNGPGTFYTIDPVTGAVIDTIVGGVPGGALGLTVDPSSGMLIASECCTAPDGSSGERIHSVNPADGSSVLLLDFDDGRRIQDFAFMGDSLTAILDSTTSNGSLTLNSDGSFDYVPDQNFCGTDSFTYHANDGSQDSNIATVTITVTCVNDAPVAVDNNYTGLEDTQQTGNVITDDTGEGVDFDVDGDGMSVFSNTPASNGVVLVNADGSFTYDPTANYCGADSFTYVITDDVSATPPSMTSNTATVSITVTCVNDAPVAVDNNYSGNEDTQQSGNVIVDDTGEGVDFDVDGDGMTILANTNVAHGTLVLNTDGSFTYDPNLNYCGPDSFDYVITDDPSATPPSLISNTATVSITVICVNDPPTVTSVVPGAQLSDYSDHIGTVIITVNDVDNVSTTLAESNEPTDSVASLSLTSTGCSVIDTESPAENGSDCTWSYDGQVLDPGDNVHAILFTASDGDGPGTVTGTHTLTILPEEATVVLDPGNDVALQVEEDGGESGPFSLFFTAVETVPDFAHIGTADYGSLNLMVPYMELVPVGPGGPIAGVCSFVAPTNPGDGYAQVAGFECMFDEVPVNTYEVAALVDGSLWPASPDTTRYYTGADDAVLVIFDPSLGFTTGGGWFYWPGTADPELLACGEDGYAGDKTNFGFNMKYNKKRTNVQGNLLMMRHTVDANCEAAGKYRVKSNALNGLSIGDDNDGVSDYGWAAFSGKSVFSEPGLDGDGNYPFLVYVEDHGDEGGNQDPADDFWIQVEDKDGNVVLETGGPVPVEDDGTDGDDVSIENGNIIVPHSGGGGNGNNK